jgi:hypothetical protein
LVKFWRQHKRNDDHNFIKVLYLSIFDAILFRGIKRQCRSLPRMISQTRRRQDAENIPERNNYNDGRGGRGLASGRDENPTESTSRSIFLKRGSEGLNICERIEGTTTSLFPVTLQKNEELSNISVGANVLETGGRKPTDENIEERKRSTVDCIISMEREMASDKLEEA